jgi:superfamily I DNA/RNA helicase
VRTFKPTPEQQLIMDVLPTGVNVKVIAPAGAGKTETLNQASRRMSGNGLFTAFNRAIIEDAKTRFPSHVDCLTTHKLAHKAIAWRYRQRLNASRSRQTAKQVAQLLGIRTPIVFPREALVVQPRQLAGLAVAAVTKFCESDRDRIRPWDVPRLDMLDPDQQAQVAEVVLPHAERIWADLRRTDRQGGGRFKFTPTHFLKLFALGRPTLAYDFLLLDEAQDTNPVVAGLFKAQTHAQLIAVGDPAQSINEWRGAIDALEGWPAERTLTLTNSFRFGQAVADEANKWLTLLGSDLRIVGAGGPSRVVDELDNPDAVLCRTNGGAATEVLNALAAGKRVALVGKSGNEIAALAEACAELQETGTTGHPELMAFTTWGQVQDYVEHDPSGGDLRPFVRVIDDQGADVVRDAMQRLVTEDQAQVVVSTAHRSKGREWPRVRVSGDFREPKDMAGEPVEPSPQEVKLAYVTVTRAKQALCTGGLSYVDARLAALTPA